VERDLLSCATKQAPLPLTSLDVNGASGVESEKSFDVVAPALPLVDLLHANLEEACHLLQISPPPDEMSVDDSTLLSQLATPLHKCGVAVVAITLGSAGAYVSVTADADRLESPPDSELARAASSWRGQAVRLTALPVEGDINANGAGDAFTAGLLAAMLWRESLELTTATKVALASARQRIDSTRRDQPMGLARILEELGIAPVY